MILALALLTVTHLAPDSTSARLLAPDTVGLSGGPALKREVIPGLKPAWVPMAVAGAITVTAVSVSLVVMLAGRVGGYAAVAVGIIGGLAVSAVHLVCAVISAVIGGSNAALRAEYEQRKRVALPPVPVSSAPPLQPTAVVLRF